MAYYPRRDSHGLGFLRLHAALGVSRRAASRCVFALCTVLGSLASADDIISQCLTLSCGARTLWTSASGQYSSVHDRELTYRVISYNWTWEDPNNNVWVLIPLGSNLDPPECGHSTFRMVHTAQMVLFEDGRCTDIDNLSINLTGTLVDTTYSPCQFPGGFSTSYSCANGWWEITPGNPGARVHGESANLDLFTQTPISGTWRVEDRGVEGYTIHIDWVGTGEFSHLSGSRPFRDVTIGDDSDFIPGQACPVDPDDSSKLICWPGNESPPPDDDDDDDDDRYPIPGPYTKPPAPERPTPSPAPEWDVPPQRDPANYDYPNCPECKILHAILDTLGTDFIRYFEEFRHQNHEIIEWLGFLWDEAAITNEILVDLMNLLIGDGADDPESPEFHLLHSIEDQLTDALTRQRDYPISEPDVIFAGSPQTSWTFEYDFASAFSSYDLFSDMPLLAGSYTVDLDYYTPFRPYVHSVVLLLFGLLCVSLIFEESRKY